MNNDFVARALHGLSTLHELESIYSRDPRALRFVVEARTGIYSAARVAEALDDDGGLPEIAGEKVPLEERLRAFYEDPLGVRSWAITAGSFFGPGVFVAARARRFLFDARVAAVYGLLDGAMAMLDGALLLSGKRRAEVHERLDKLAEAAAKVLRPDSAFDKREEEEPVEETAAAVEEPAAVAAEEPVTVVEKSVVASGEGDADVAGGGDEGALPETMPAPAPETEPGVAAPEVHEEAPVSEPKPIAAGNSDSESVESESSEESAENVVEISKASATKSRRRKSG